MVEGNKVVPGRDDRFHGQLAADKRTQGQRDRDRVLYTSALRRLGAVTQVVSPEEGVLFHNRLTHTLEAAQIGLRLAENLRNYNPPHLIEAVGGIDPDVVEAATLAHDLGHPPFGHTGETVLNDLVTNAGVADGYEGNAQSFRIVTKLAVRTVSNPGLNLTCATLNALMKYPWQRETAGKRNRKWGAYSTEGPEFRWARSARLGIGYNRSFEAELVDWADDVAYAVHDAEDFYRAGLIPLDRLTTDYREVERFLERAVKRLRDVGDYSQEELTNLTNAFEQVISNIPISERYRGTRSQRSLLRTVTASLIARYINAIEIADTPNEDGTRVRKNPTLEREVTILKQLTHVYVIENPSLVTQQHGQQQVIKELFNIFIKAAGSGNLALFPEAFQEELDKSNTHEERVRIVADLIASMTEHQALTMHKRLVGTSPGSVLDAIGR